MDFAAMFQTWMNVLFHPGEAVFEEERAKPQAKLSTAIIWVVIAAVIAAIFAMFRVVVQSLVMGGASMWGSMLSEMPPQVQQQFGEYFAANAGLSIVSVGGAFCMSLILTPIFFLIGSAVWFALAKIFGGSGEFEEQTYLLATFSAPLMIVNGVISVIPFLGGCVAFIIFIYQLVLTYSMLKVAHNLTSGKALTVVLIPTLVVILCVICVVGGMFVAALGVMGSAGSY